MGNTATGNRGGTWGRNDSLREARGGESQQRRGKRGRGAGREEPCLMEEGHLPAWGLCAPCRGLPTCSWEPPPQQLLPEPPGEALSLS